LNIQPKSPSTGTFKGGYLSVDLKSSYPVAVLFSDSPDLPTKTDFEQSNFAEWLEKQTKMQLTFPLKKVERTVEKIIEGKTGAEKVGEMIAKNNGNHHRKGVSRTPRHFSVAKRDVIGEAVACPTFKKGGETEAVSNQSSSSETTADGAGDPKNICDSPKTKQCETTCMRCITCTEKWCQHICRDCAECMPLMEKCVDDEADRMQKKLEPGNSQTKSASDSDDDNNRLSTPLPSPLASPNDDPTRGSLSTFVYSDYFCNESQISFQCSTGCSKCMACAGSNDKHCEGCGCCASCLPWAVKCADFLEESYYRLEEEHYVRTLE
jgi:hypothetical protein